MKPPNRLQRGSGSVIAEADKLGQLPKGWAQATIQDMISKDGIFCDGDWVETKDQDPNGDVRLIQLADIGDGIYKGKSSRYLTGKKAAELKCTFLKRGDVLIARMPDPLGRACIFPGDSKDSVTAVDVCIVRTGENGVGNRWLMFTTNSLLIRTAIASLQSGSTRKRISRKNLGKILFPVPPLNEQKRIVAKIEELFTKLDAGVAALKKIKTQLKRYRQAVLKHAFEGALTENWRQAHKGQLEPASVLLERIAKERTCLPKGAGKGKAKKLPPLDTSKLPELPEGWEWATIGILAKSMKNGIYKPRHFYCDDGAACLRMYNIFQGKIIWEDIKRMNLSDEEIEEYGLVPGDILVNRVNSRELVGKAAPIPEGLEPCVFESKNIRLRVYQDFIKSKYVGFWFLLYAQEYFSQNAQQVVGMASISQVQLASMPIPFTSVPEQESAVAEIERHFSVADQIEQTVEQGLKQSGRLRQSILKKAFEGKLVPQDPEDEPAEKLLERIKAGKARPQTGQRAKQKTTKRRNAKQLELFANGK